MPNRTLCEVLGEMRTCIKTLNFSYLLALIEEAQTMGNRMRASLWDQKELARIRKDIKEAKEKLRELKGEINSNDNLKNFIDNMKK